MGGSVIRRLIILLGIKADAGDAPKVGEALDAMAKKAEAAKRRLIGVAGAVSAAIGAAVIGTSRHVQEVSRWSDALGVPVEDMQALGIAFQGVGLEMEDAADLMFTAAERLVDAGVDGPASDAAMMAKRLGISLKEANGDIRTHESILFDVADAMQRVATDTERTAIANTFFGDVGVRSLGLLKQGGEALRMEVERIKESGAVMTQEEIDNVREANKEFHRLATSLKGFVFRALGPLFRVLAKQVLPAIRDTVDSITAWIKVGDRLERINKAIAAGFRLLGFALASFGIFKAVTGFIALGKAVRLAALALRALGTQALFAQAKLFLIPATIALILLLLEDISVWMRGGDSLIGRFIDKFRESDGVLGSLARGLEAIKPILKDVFAFATKVVGQIFASLAGEGGAFLKTVVAGFKEFVKIFMSVAADLLPIALGLIKIMMTTGRGLFKTAMKLLKAVMPPVVRIVKSMGRVFARLLPMAIKGATLTIGIIAKVLAWVLPKVASAVEFVVDVIDTIAPAVESMVDKAITVVQKIANVVSSMITFFSESVPSFFARLFEQVKTGLAVIRDWIVEKWDGLIETVKTAFQALADFFGIKGDAVTSWWTTLKDTIKEAFEFIIEWAEKALGVVGKVIDGVSTVVDGASGAIDAAGDFFFGEDEPATGGSGGSGGFLGRQAQALAMRNAGGAAAAGGAGDRNTQITQTFNVQGNADPATVQAAARRGAAGGVDAAERRAATRDLAVGG